VSAPVLEKTVQAACVALLKRLGFDVWPTSQHPRGPLKGIRSGVSDLIAMHRAVGVVFVEVKRPGEKQRASQVDFQLAVERAGGEYWLVDSEESLVARLRTAGVIR